MDDLDLFLVHADDDRPVLQEGLPPDALTGAPRPPPEPPPRYLRYDTGDAHSLPQQRWGLIAPEGPDGDRLLGAVDPLSRARREAQDADVRIYRVPAGMGAAEAARWKEQVYEDESVLPEHRPRYLLILGDADLVSWDLQQRLSFDTFVGRIAFASERGYEAYAAKVLRWERASPAPGARALFFTARDGSAATTLGDRQLMQPAVARMNERAASGVVSATDIAVIDGGSPDALLEQAARPGPAFLFSISHGLGAPALGWRAPGEQRALQGAMALDRGRRLTAADVGGRPFLPGGVWFFFACYSAGTPSTSAYHRWLRVLWEAGRYEGRVDRVLAGLPAAGDRPFVAALPQALLESADGPLAVIGHVDLVWSFSFRAAGTAESRAGRFQDVLRALADGGRAGPACFELLRFWADTDARLAMLQGDQDRAEDEAGAALKAYLWMLRSDLRGYALLGDPAARLAIVPGAPAVWAPVEVRDAKQMEQAVLAALLRRELPSAIARRAGIDKGELQRWVDAYREAGRAALAKVGR
jgi:hypothetical protein